jgi:transcriptional regulator with XRE-family HTH domain
MPWRPNGKQLRALREKRGWTLDELAAKSGVSDRQIRAIESPHPPATMQLRTIRDLSGALKCEREQVATWVESGAPAPAASREDDDDAAKLPPASTLARRAAAERKAKIRPRRLRAGDGAEVEVLGFDRLYELDAAFGEYAGARLGVEGAVTEHRPIPRYVEPILDVKAGIGAQFLLVRKVAREPLYVSLYTRAAAHTRRLIEAERAGTPVAAVARVVVARPKGEWKGFFIFEKKPKPHSWALLIEELL